ncbi:MAG: peptidoglycan-binding protein [Tetrasphaera sp.]|nr:peptidoglycan-binding protein [Tetrasphaera sp.]
MTAPSPARSRTLAALVIAMCVMAAGVALGILLVRSSSMKEPDAENWTTFTVKQATISKIVPVTARISWPHVTGVDIPIGGRLTQSVPANGRIAPNDVLLRVDDEPVLLARGGIPAYRDLRPGDRGNDVRQLQELLQSRGFDIESDGRFGSGTARAVVSLWTSLGSATRGEVPLGRIVWVPTLPTRVVPAESLRLGASVPSPAFSVVSGNPTVSIVIPPALADRVTDGTSVSISLADRDVSSVTVGPVITAADGSLTATVDPKPFRCGEQTCAARLFGSTDSSATLTVTPRTTGLAVPVSALRASATGDVSVMLMNGQVRSVTVRAQSDGLAIIDGIASGDKVRVPGS